MWKARVFILDYIRDGTVSILGLELSRTQHCPRQFKGFAVGGSDRDGLHYIHKIRDLYSIGT